VILDTLQEVVEAAPPVAFAYVYGSLLEDRPFHDVDVAVYLDMVDEQGMGRFALKLAVDLEKSLFERCNRTLPVDVRVLNQAPLGFRYHVFRGKLLFSRDEALRVQEVARTVGRYLDLEPLQRRALKEAMAALRRTSRGGGGAGIWLHRSWRPGGDQRRRRIGSA
jgi:predicted nucleotidyltransferase